MQAALLTLLTVAVIALAVFRQRTLWAFRTFLRPHLSMALNYVVYLFRRCVVLDSAEKARREHHAGYAERQADSRLRKELPNVVVANSNRDKYTETFVRRHIEALRTAGFYVHQLYGGDLPTVEVRQGSLLSNSAAWLAFYGWVEAFFDLPSGHFARRAFKSYLVQNRIGLVLAEFGPCAAQVFDLCEEADVPIIAVFHGYDAHHQATVHSNLERYQGLFRSAAEIICVSDDILKKLLSLGAPAEKLVHLPCGFDASRFTYSDHSSNGPAFLAVGRFAETKAPHLTILAFNEVLRSIPEAQLVMIGKDGGGELFEACHILVKALGIDDRVFFRGILSSDGVLDEMRKARVFVQHSVTTPLNGDREGTPVSVMEAMAVGLPIISTRHAGIAELIEDGISGVLVDECNHLAMSQEMVKICLSDELVFTFGQEAAKRIKRLDRVMNSDRILAEIVENCRKHS